MNYKIDEYLNNSKEVQLSNVPFSKNEIIALLEDSKSISMQTIINRLKNYIGWMAFMLVSIFLVIVLYLNLPISDNKQLTQAPFKENYHSFNFDNFSSNQSTPNFNKNIGTNSNNYEQIKDTISKIIVLKTTKFNIEDINWSQVYFNLEDWSFKWVYKTERVKIYNEFGKFQEQNFEWQEVIDDKYLIRISNQLEKSIDDIVDLSLIKSFSNSDLSNFYLKLSEVINDLEVDKVTLEKLILYAQINMKFLNNPGEKYKIKSKGIILDKETLTKLGLVFTDSSFSIPIDLVVPNIDEKEKLFGSYQIDNVLTNIKIPDEDAIIGFNLIYEWDREDLKNYTKEPVWMGAMFNMWNRERFSFFCNFFDDIILDTIKLANKPHKINVQSYINYNGLRKLDDVNPLSPIIFDNIKLLGNYDALLFNGNSDMRKLYELNCNIALQNYGNSHINQSNTRIFINDSLKNKLIKENLEKSIKYKYLIPVSVQIPYYNFTKTELESMPNATYITLWYYPNERFMSVIPDDLRLQLENELKLLESIQTGEIQQEIACENVVPGNSLLGLCNISQNSITNLKIFPNPASDYINVKFDLSDKSMYKIYLTDAFGLYLKDICNWTTSDMSQINLVIPTTELQNGAYILNIITEKSDKVISKFLINR